MTTPTAPVASDTARLLADLAACQRRIDALDHEIYWRGFASCSALYAERDRLWKQGVRLERALGGTV